MLDRCVAAAHGDLLVAGNQREANVFRLGAMVIQSRLPAESAKLMAASDRHFLKHPGDLVPAADVVHNGWLFGLPPLRDMLTARLRPQNPVPVMLQRR
ncbi:hypothetical protein [Cupriavidus sp. IDO]|uniref:hypothetical protein n=1 Tax=Cupriavidus sp. IDO TaxID=1539142 RepID=UPI0005798609|nr:hypothetical protein [Cupriavidus sp. IDO]KWR90418.1 hypothetical protein RM96_09325 [Cupriavidus sp. IDO]